MRYLVGVILCIGLLAVLGCPAPAPAGSCAVRARPAVVVTEKVTVAAVATVVPVAVYQPVAVLVPAYTAAYAPAPAPPAPAPAPAAGPSADTKAILDALKQFDARLAALEGRGAPPRGPLPGPAPAPVPPPVPPPGPGPGPGDDPFNPAPPPAGARAPGKAPAVFVAKCAQCHQRGKESAGGDFVLMELDGSVSKLDARAILSTARRSYNGTMPPKSSKVPPLTDQEVAEVMSWLDSVK